MTEGHQEFFDNIDWYRREDCERLPEELAWSRRECPIVHTNYDGGTTTCGPSPNTRTSSARPCPA
jgi:hypothetical protein